MGLDLDLLPFDADFFSHTLLSCERRQDLFERVLLVEGKVGRDVPDNFQSYTSRSEKGDACYGKTLRTPYGDNLKYVLASDLMKFLNHDDVSDNEKNRAIWAYMGKLRADTKVALYWH